MKLSLIASGVKQQHEALLDLVEFPFLTAEIEPHAQSFPQSLFKRWRQWRLGVEEKCCDTHRSCVPSETIRRPDVRFIQRLLSRLLMVRFMLDMFISIVSSR